MQPKTTTTQDPTDRDLQTAGVATSALTPESRDLVRSELNIEKWPGMWKPAKSKNRPAVRVLERDIALPGGGRMTARVELGFTHLGELTTEDQRTYYALVKQWEISGRPKEQTFFSIRGLARFLNKKWGTNVVDAVTQSLRRLRATPFTWQNAYRDGVSKDTLEVIDTFSILSELKIIRQKTDGHVSKEAGYFRFNDFITRNLLARHTKPVLFETILKFQSEVAQLVYSHVDLLMADKRHYERRSRELFENLGLKGKEYARLYERKRILARALEELQGVPLTTGVVASATIEKTQDKKDYKVVFVKANALFGKPLTQGASRGEVIALPPNSKSLIDLQAEELVVHFHKLFHKVSRVYPQSKEVNQAISLIASHGVEQARYIVDFSHRAAAQTNYAPQTLGGILQYTSQAVAAYEANQREIEESSRNKAQAANRRKWEELQKRVDEARRDEARAKLDRMPDEDRKALYERVKRDLVARRPWLTPQSNSARSSQFFERLVRSAMVDELIVAGSGEKREKSQLA
jgi:hypothetical protein